MKIYVIGAGALGLLFGGLLSKQNEVTLIEASTDVVNEIKEKGVSILDASTSQKEVVHPNIALSGNAKGKADLVLILTKTYSSESALSANRNIMQEDTYLMSFQNGLGNDEKLRHFVKEDHLILGVTRINAVRNGANETTRVNHGETIFGLTKENEGFLLKLKSIFQEASFDISLSKEVKKLIYEKLFLNLICNSLCSYYRVSMRNLLEKEKWEVAKAILIEAVNVANAEGFSFDAEKVIETQRKFLCQVDGYPSMYQDIMNKRPTEIDTINGAITSLGKKYGIATPTNSWIVEQIKAIENKNLPQANDENL